ncbi:hypothetical protein ACFO5O_01410 [Geojedonia litorea]|uniref:Nuclear transport factor 2 family protein n=1 Tax=Geojedonia litorea TaxID=1268269 RepID=A0ABV9N319_9FLAO
MKNLIIITFIFFIIFSCAHEAKHKKDDSKMNSTDETEILNTINNVYNNIIVESNKTPDFKTIKEQFVEQARLGYIINDSLILKSPNEYFDTMERMLTQNKPEYLKEWEIKGTTKFFGKIAQRTSLYGVHFNTTDSLTEKGIINFQLVKINNEWKILSMLWESEKKGVLKSDNYFD